MAQFLTPLKSNMTAGERRFANILKRYLDDDYLVWYDLPTNSKIRRFPDFVIFNHKYGLWVIEVKDWSLGNIRNVNSSTITLWQNNMEKHYDHPRVQARDCLMPIINTLNTDKLLVSNNGKYQGKLAFPYGCCAVMTRWNITQFEKHQERDKLLECFSHKETFFANEIADNLVDQKTFLKKLHDVLPYHFPSALTKEQADKVRAHIFPEVVIEQGSLFDDDELPMPDIVSIMDNKQELLARSLGDGHRVIHGVAGSGKTILLEHRAKELAAQNPEKEILVVCYNILLATRLKQRLQHKKIKVIHFHGLCYEIRKKFNLNIVGDYKKQLAPTVCKAIIENQVENGAYHAVLIDEGHDFAPNWLEALTKLPTVEHNHLLLLYDDAQSIYDNNKGIDFTLSSVGIRARGRTSVLKINYRNSQEILIAAERFLRHFVKTSELNDDDDIPMLSIESAGVKTDHFPILKKFRNQYEEFAGVLSKIQQWHQEGIAFGDMAILYINGTQAEKLKNFLISKGLSVYYIGKTQDNKKNYLNKPDTITICTIHSSKGSEFSHVILYKLDDFFVTPKQSNERVIYVGMTRARNELFMTTVKSNKFTQILSSPKCRVVLE